MAYPKMSRDQFVAGFREVIDIMGRPDFTSSWSDQFLWTYAKKFLPYVHSTSRNACLIHKVTSVKMKWYQGNYGYLRRLDQPSALAKTVCGRSIFLTNGKRSGKMCSIPDPNAVLCGTCHGELPTFSKRRKDAIKKRWAKDHLGCKGLDEVIGPYEYQKQEKVS